ncbi:MAG: PTS lactose/cellobiose transporter subunit IIA [Treponema sp.]|nr:PTS lactose/cellobiose transporter subunit IIA [Treponema sp.]
MDHEPQELDQEMVDVAMSIIMDAGDARAEIAGCFSAMASGDIERCDELLSKARLLLAKAHGRQTEIIQDEIDGARRQHSLLFIHAQDTLMAVNSEMNICRYALAICRNYEARIDALEKRGLNER